MPFEMDFDDAIAALREVAERPLPLRINEWRVFVAVLLEQFCPPFCLRRPSVILRKLKPISLIEDAEDLRDALSQFQKVPIPSDRFQRVPMLFAHGMAQRAMRLDLENTILTRALRRGRYLGWTAWLLAVDATLILLVTEHYLRALAVFASLLFAQAVTLLICTYDWHYR